MKQLSAFLMLLLAYSVNGQKISGTVTDSSGNKIMAGVSVSLTPKIMTTTNDLGKFELPYNFPVGTKHQLLLTYIGYQPKVIVVTAAGDLGTILLNIAQTQLGNVTVTASKPLVKQEIDRISYDVQSDPQAKGQSAMDMLRRVPLLTVDGDDNIQLQGSGSYRIFINGKPSALVTMNPKDVLRSMPAAMIMKIEVITTPPAKYDAEGLAGIINIITTKKTDEGYSGTLTLRENFPFGPNLNLSATGKWNRFGISGYGGAGIRPKVGNDIETFRKTYGATSYILDQPAHVTNNGSFRYGGFESSYEIDSLQLLTGSLNVFGGNTNTDLARHSSYYTDPASVLQSYSLESDGNSHYKGIDLGINYQLGFKKKKEQLLTVSYRYSWSANNQFNLLHNSSRVHYDAPDNTQFNDAGSKETTVQLDYVHPLKKITMEAGLKAILRDISSEANGEVYDAMSGGFINDPSRATHLSYLQNIYSFYNSYRYSSDKWAFQAGIRGEITDIHADFAATATTLSKQYTNVIPSLSIQKKMTDNRSLTFGITNRIMRPGGGQLNPFIDRSNPQLISTGNPDLRPVISHLFELGYNRGGRSSLNLKLSYLYINNSIESVTKVLADTLSLTSYDNVGQQRILRFNIYGNYPIGSKITINFNTGVFYVWIKGTYNGRFYTNEGPRTNTFANFTYKANANWQFGASGGYNRRYINLQGSSNDYWYTTFSATYTLKKFSFSSILNNPFMGHYFFNQYTSTPDFYQSNGTNQVYRNVNLSISYKFGKLNSSLKKNKRGINNDDTSGNSN